MVAHAHSYPCACAAAAGQGTSVLKVAIDVLLQFAHGEDGLADGALTYAGSLHVMVGERDCGTLYTPGRC